MAAVAKLRDVLSCKTETLSAPCFLVVLLIAAHVCLALGYATVMPALNWPDEPAHLNYAAALARGEGFGTMGSEVWGGESLTALIDDHFSDVGDPLADERLRATNYQAHQPPLYYALAGLILDRSRGLLGLRLLNLLLSSLSLIGVFLFVRRSLGNDQVALVAVGFLALLPTRTFMAVSIGNDPAIELVFVLFFLVLATTSGKPPTSRRSEKVAGNTLGPTLTLGALLGVGLLTKATALLLPVLQALWQRHRERALMLLRTSLVGLLIASPWLVRNVLVYGALDPLALRAGALGAPHRPTLEISGPHGIGPFFELLFTSFWGVFGWMEMFPGPPLLVLYLILSLIAVAGLLRTSLGFGRLELPTRALVNCLAAASLGVSSVLLYSLSDFQPQGRYLFPLSAPLALLMAVGWLQAPKRRGPTLALAVLAAMFFANLYNVLYLIPWYLER